MQTELNSLKINAKGQVTISSGARRQLELLPNTNLIEIVVNNCLVLIPQREVLSGILSKAKDSMESLGIDDHQYMKSFLRTPTKKKVAKRRSKSK